MHLTVELPVACAQFSKPGDVAFSISLVLAKLDHFLVLDTVRIRGKFDFVRELVLDALLHLGLDLRSFLLTFGDKLRHAVVACDKNSNTAFQ